MINLHELARIAAVEFPDIVYATAVLRNKLRVVLKDKSFIDFWWSEKIPGRFAHHWERRHIDGTIYRHDNMPHPRWRHIRTYPQHFHNGAPDRVEESRLQAFPPEIALRQFLEFARRKLK